MPPISQPGSRAGLITALVVFVIGTFAGASLYMYEHIEHEKIVKENEDLRKLRDKIGPDIDIADKYESLKTQFKAQGKTILDMQAEQQKKLQQAIGGDQNAAAGDTMKQAADAVRNVSTLVAPAQVNIEAGATLMSVTSTLGNAVVQKELRIHELTDQLAKAMDTQKAQTAAQEDLLKQRDLAVEAARKMAEDEKARAITELTKKDQQMADHDKAMVAETEKLQGAINTLNVQFATKVTEVNDQKTLVAALQKKLARLRVDTSKALLRKPDGVVAKVTGTKTVYINLGFGDQISSGMTFEVYDSIEGILKPDAVKDDQLPRGKASIEVVNVGQNLSECQIIASMPGQVVGQGDVIANLIYDRNVKYNFFVYPGGGFDLNQNGRPNTRDTGILKNLVTQWGGALTEGAKPTINTDFVVMGKEPVVPKLDDPNDPKAVFLHDQALKQLKEYQEVVDMANDLHIPVLNQNRFLVYIGYFDMARRGS